MKRLIVLAVLAAALAVGGAVATATAAPPPPVITQNVEDDHTGGCVWVPPNVPWYCLIPIVWCDPSVFIGYWRC